MSEYKENCIAENGASASILPNSESKVKTENDTEICKLYKKRWFILFLFVAYSTVSLVQWIEYSIIANIVVEYYGVSFTAVDWSSMIYLLLYIVFSVPGFYLLDKVDFRISVIVGAFLTCAGAWVKLASVAPDKYWILLVGQGIVSVGQVLILPAPPKLAAAWFGAKEVSTACSIAVVGGQLGIGLGYLVPPMVVSNTESPADIERGLHRLALGTAIASSIVLLLILGLFKREPSIPPSIAQLRIRNEGKAAINFFPTVRRLLLNKSYMLLLVSYSLNVGVYYAISIIFNQIVLKHYPGATEDAGRLGFLMTIVSVVASVACGAILDKLNRFRETTLGVYAASVLAMVAFTFLLNQGMGILYFLSLLLGSCLAGVLMIGLQLSTELTYPEPDGTAAGLLTTFAQVLGIAFTYLYSFVFNTIGDVWANGIMSMFLLLGLILTACIRFDLRRQAAQTSRCLSLTETM